MIMISIPMEIRLDIYIDPMDPAVASERKCVWDMNWRLSRPFSDGVWTHSTYKYNRNTMEMEEHGC